MNRQAEIRERLEAAFTPETLEVIDDSESHRGHAGYPEGGQSHFIVRMKAAGLAGKTRVAQHRAVYDALGDLMPQIHALNLDLSA
ncbi:BolA family protein [Pseudooceanicola sp. 200-1SW]|uniref:BolA family protein n=1 Tax=Pseudooceanicola sp. 200-1SW TaxID=3425949 RepID=UPI003D7FD94A